MSLSPGQKLAHYEIVALIGKGGMGEVYRARDTKLGREVAIKVLPDELARDSERLSRFEREAKLLAALNHPGVATLHGLERIGAQPCLVMELVEGETLAERIALGAIPANEAIPVFEQIADGLDAAHEKGIIHRDLKPANIKITPDGRVKILDFGLAKALLGDEDVSAETSQSPTLTKGTALGVVMGTASYMSPEQARGKHVDKRADIWAFGCCLYEALTGRKAFDGETVSDIIGSVLRDEPDLVSLAPGVRRILAHCLEKDPRTRLRDIGDARLLLAEDASSTSSSLVQTTSRRRLLWPLLAGAGLAAAAVVALWPSSAPPPPVSRFYVNLPETDELYFDTLTTIAISPDGRRLAYATKSQIFVRSLDELEPTPIPATESGGTMPFFSHDGEWLGFWKDGKLQKVHIAGGAPVTLCSTARVPLHVSWTEDDFVIYDQDDGIRRVPAAGGSVETVLSLDPTAQWFRGGQILPDGETALFSMRRNPSGEPRIVLQSLESEERRVLLDGRDPRYVRSGHVIYQLGGSLMAVAFDGDALRMAGDPAPVVEGVYSSYGVSHFAVSDNGTLAYVPSSRGALASLVWVDREGAFAREGDVRADYEDPRISPDGSRLLFSIEPAGGTYQIWTYDRERGSRALLSHEFNTFFPVWSPDGTRVAFTSLEVGAGLGLRLGSTDGSGESELLVQRGNDVPMMGAFSWTPDGEALAFYERRLTAGGSPDENIRILRRSGDEWVDSPFLETPFMERSPMISPGGRFIAYVSDESGQNEVYARTFPGGDSKWVVSVGGGTEPRWSRDGRELFYRNGDQLLVVDVRTSGTDFEAGRPELLFEGSFAREPQGNTNYDVSADGERFLMVQTDEAARMQEIVVVLNWYSELERLAPPEK